MKDNKVLEIFSRLTIKIVYKMIELKDVFNFSICRQEELSFHLTRGRLFMISELNNNKTGWILLF